MDKCKYKTATGICTLMCDFSDKHRCKGEKYCHERRPMTNADRIRAMSDDELAVFLNNTEACDKQPIEKCAEADTPAYCVSCTLEWLQQPAEGD